MVHCAIITVSDTRSPADDHNGQYLQKALTEANHQVDFYVILPDEPARIRQQVQDLAENRAIEVILLNGGTGIAPRDTTYDAISALLEKTLPGFGEIFRQLSYAQIGSRAIASRALAGTYRSKLVFSMPGSNKAVQLAMEALILPELVHLVGQLRGEHPLGSSLPMPQGPL